MAARLATILVTLLLGGMLGAALVRFAPGYGIDERELDHRLSQESIAALRQSRPAQTGFLAYYFDYLARLSRGDLGVSISLGRPVGELLAERLPVTARSVGLGFAGAWLAGLLLALSTQFLRIPGYDLLSTAVSGFFLCLPSAVLALLFLYLEAPPGAAIAAVLFPQVFRYARNLFVSARDLPHVLLAKAKGLPERRILFWHILPPAAPHLLSLLGVSLSIAFTAAIPVEVFCDSPGVGQLAWQAALGRDLPVLVNLTLLTAALTLTATFLSDLATSSWTAQGSSEIQRA